MRKLLTIVAVAGAIGCGGSNTAPTTKDTSPKVGRWTLASIDGFSLPHQFGTGLAVRNNQIVGLPSYAVWGRIDVVAEPCCSWIFSADSTDGEPFSSVGNNEVTFLPLADGRLAVVILNSFAAADTATVYGDEELTIRMAREPDGLLHDYRYTYSGPLPPP